LRRLCRTFYGKTQCSAKHKDEEHLTKIHFAS
jgi:hypothetical protein